MSDPIDNPRETLPSSRPESASDLPRGASIGRYLILARLGAGAMGMVYAAYDPELDRRVALKLLGEPGLPHPYTSAGRSLIMREARALARLSHPNVLPIYDVGSFGPMVFITTELVEGEDFASWQQRQRSWQRTLDVYLQAGRGLAAAHAAGVIHRDIKPQNLMLGTDGRVRVMDFGLARADRLADAPEDMAADPATAGASAGTWVLPGGIAGTPGYIAPELLAGTVPGPLSDQFSFAVSLYEGLYGQSPFTGADLFEMAEAARQGAIRPPPANAKAPAGLQRILRQCLAADPQQRLADMDTLLAQLEAERHRGGRVARRSALTAMAAIALAVVGYVATQDQRSVEICQGGPQKLIGSWDADLRAGLQEHARRIGSIQAGAGVQLASAQLDRYAGAWIAEYQEACAATRLRGEQSEQLMDLRMLCLQDRGRELRAFTDLLRQATPEVMEQAPTAVAELTPVSVCADTRQLLARAPLPDDPVARQRIERLQEREAAARALSIAGQYDAALGIAEPLLPEAATLAYPPLQARLQLLAGIARDRNGDYPEAERHLLAAAAAAIAADDDRVLTESYTSLVWLLGYRRADYAAADRWSQLAHAVLQRAGNPPDLEAELINADFTYIGDQGRYDEQIRLGERAVQLREQVYGREHLQYARGLVNLATGYHLKGDYQRAGDLYRQALPILRQTVGDGHPSAITLLSNYGALLKDQGQFAEAATVSGQAAELATALFGNQAVETGAARINYAEALSAAGQPDEALTEVRGGLDTLRHKLGPDAHLLAYGLGIEGRILLILDQPGAARDALQHSRELGQGKTPPEFRVQLLADLARATWSADGDAAAARTLLEQAESLLPNGQDQPAGLRAEIQRLREQLAPATDRPAGGQLSRNRD